jgi:hypothetical protein
LNPGRQALLVLVHLRKGKPFAELAAGFAVGTATAWRYARETITLLAARAPKRRKALTAAKKAGHAFVAIDGTLIPIDRVAADRPSYSGKHRRHGMNLQVISSPAGEILWVSGPLPGATHDLTAARIWGIIRELADACLDGSHWLASSPIVVQCCTAKIRPRSCESGTAPCDAGAAVKESLWRAAPSVEVRDIGAGLCPIVVAALEGSLCQERVLE